MLALCTPISKIVSKGSPLIPVPSTTSSFMLFNTNYLSSSAPAGLEEVPLAF